MACSECGKNRGHLDGCPTLSGGRSEPPKKQSRKGKRTEVLDNVSEEAADKWIKRMGSLAQGGGKKRHYEKKPDPQNPGKYVLVFVEDE